MGITHLGKEILLMVSVDVTQACLREHRLCCLLQLTSQTTQLQTASSGVR